LTLATTRSEPKLELKGISKSFPSRTGEGEVEVLRNIDLALAEGEFVSLVGASGCGKTTLLRIIDGLIKPSSGEVAFRDEPLGTGIGGGRSFVFQSDALLPWRTVLDNVALGLEAKGTKRKAAREAALPHLELVGLADFAQYYPHEISGGMRQRVNLARALAVEPALLLMDEPFAALDAQTREIMQGELLRIWNASQANVVFVTHQIEEAVYLSDRVVVMGARPGRVREIVEVDMPRPRPLAIKRTPSFVAIADRIWRLIEEEVKASVDPQAERLD
jgi:NitT/TauT family transport system ATP-binding protein